MADQRVELGVSHLLPALRCVRKGALAGPIARRVEEELLGCQLTAVEPAQELERLVAGKHHSSPGSRALRTLSADSLASGIG
jgi:hypothetical protein